MAYRLTGDDEDAVDVTQDTYLRAYRALDRFPGDARFQTWLYRITVNSASTLLGQRARDGHDELTEEAPVADDRIHIDPVARAEGDSLRHHLTDALRRLPPGLRAVVVLRDVYDLPHDAIAEELDISVTVAKVRLHRARRRLRDDLSPIPHEGEPCGVSRWPTGCPAAAEGLQALDPAARRHVERCLRCQADAVQYRKVLRAMRALRTEVLVPARAWCRRSWPAMSEAGERQAVRSLLRGRRAAYLGGLAAATAAAGAGAVVLKMRNRRGKVRLAG